MVFPGWGGSTEYATLVSVGMGGGKSGWRGAYAVLGSVGITEEVGGGRMMSS